MAAVVGKRSTPRKRTPPKQVLSKWKDLERIGASQSALAERVEEIYLQTPEKVFLNDEVCAEYGHYCYTTQGDCTHSINQESTIMTTGESKIVSNETSQAMKLKVELESVQTVGVTVTVRKGSDFSTGQRISLTQSDLGLSELASSPHQSPIVIENTTGYSGDNTKKVRVAHDVQVSLNPGKKAMVTQELSWTELKGEFAIPFGIEGWCMSLFGRQVNGQRLWLHELSSLFDLPVSELQGELVCVCDVRGSVNIQPLPMNV